MKVGIMQPYILPYIGYFQLLNMVDAFVIYDNIKYTKKGWINRNRILINETDEYFTIPLRKDSDSLNISQRVLSDTYSQESDSILRRITGAYRKAPFYSEVMTLAEAIFRIPETNLFEFLHKSLRMVSNYIGIDTPFIISSQINVDHSLKGQDRVIAICKSLGCTEYINPIGGTSLYDSDVFKRNDIDLFFFRSQNVTYKQFENEFVPWLSILDVLMFNSKAQIKENLMAYNLESNAGAI